MERVSYEKFFEGRNLEMFEKALSYTEATLSDLIRYTDIKPDELSSVFPFLLEEEQEEFCSAWEEIISSTGSSYNDRSAPIISAYSHVFEYPTMWRDRLDRKFRDRAPHIEPGLSEKEGDFFVSENIDPLPVTEFFGAGVPLEEQIEYEKKGLEAVPFSIWDPIERLKDQKRDGIAAEVIYASMGLHLFMMQDAQLKAACFQVYNEWLSEYCSVYPRSLAGLSLVSLEDVRSGAQELERSAKRGLKGGVISAVPEGTLPYDHHDYDIFWATAQDLDLPLSLHPLSSRKGVTNEFSSQSHTSRVPVLHQEIERSLSMFILGGVLERFPRLKVIFPNNNDVIWMAYFMWRMDIIHSRSDLRGVNVRLQMNPSDYVKRQVYGTFVRKPRFLGILDKFGPDNVMWSSNYPYKDSTWPNSRNYILEGSFSTIYEDDMKKIKCDNAAQIFGIDVFS